MRTLICFAAMLQFAISVTSDQKKCGRSLFSVPGFKLHGLGIKTFTTSSKETCQAKCTTDNNCKSVNFNSEQRKCELNNGNHLIYPEHLLPADGFAYYDLNKLTKRCSKKLCSDLLECVSTQPSRYQCLPCWKARLFSTNVLAFPRKSAYDKVEWIEPFTSSLSAFTIVLWFQVDPVTPYHSVMTYSHPDTVNGISLHQNGHELEIIIGNTHVKRAPLHLVDGYWHHLTLTWDNTDGKWTFAVNGTEKYSGYILDGETIPKGVFVIGQAPKVYLGKYSDSRALQGNVTMVNMWDKVLSPMTIADIMYYKCEAFEQGNIVKWDDLLMRISGQVKRSCTKVSFCTL